MPSSDKVLGLDKVWTVWSDFLWAKHCTELTGAKQVMDHVVLNLSADTPGRLLKGRERAEELQMLSDLICAHSSRSTGASIVDGSTASDRRTVAGHKVRPPPKKKRVRRVCSSAAHTVTPQVEPFRQEVSDRKTMWIRLILFFKCAVFYCETSTWHLGFSAVQSGCQIAKQVLL